MDDIYGDLENYNDVNIIVELRNENKDLKFKIEEYATNMDKLQKDFDKISSEFKKLEINYSSLLKTARAEIERKTQIITNLNMEKDMMVLNAIQNSNKSLLLLRRNIMRDKTSNRKPEGKPNKPNLKDIQESKLFEAERERLDENRLRSTDTVSTENTDDINKVANIENKLGKLEMYDQSAECKENVKVKRAQGLRNRRKSMPALNKQLAKFSSDEEYGDNRSAEGVTNQWPPRDDSNRRTYDRYKHLHKISETSGIDEKYSSHHESSRETCYKGKPHRYSDKYRNPRHKYEAQRFKRQFSPERGGRPRDFPDDAYQRSELPRHRVLESPPLDKYDPQRRYRERRPNYENDEITEDRTKYRQERVVGKHKASSDYTETYSKRVKIDHCGNTAVPVEGDNRRRRGDAPPPPPQPQKAFPGFQKELLNSCQSPDYKPDVISQPVKEIRHTAVTELEDPRNTSKKYTKKIEVNQVTISTIIGRNVPLKVIDKSTWKIPQVKVPKALQRPPRGADEYTELLYADLENPVSNMSVESGEIHSETNDGFMADYVTRSFFQDYENEREYQKSLRDQGVDFPYRGHDDIQTLCSNTTDMNLNRQVENVDVNLKSNLNDTKIKTCGEKDGSKPRPHDIDTKLCRDNIKINVIPCQSNVKTNLEPYDGETYSKSSQNPDDTNIRSSCIYDRILPEPLQQIVSVKSNFDDTQSASEPAKYKIPKKKKPTEEHQKEANASNPLGVLLGQLHSICGVSKEAKPPEPKLDVDKTFGPDEEIKPQRNQNVEDPTQKRQYRARRKMSAREMVADDLELSDETCDNVEEHKIKRQENEKSCSISEHASQKSGETVIDTIEPHNLEDKSKNSNKGTGEINTSAENTAEDIVFKKTRKTSKKPQKQKVAKEPSKDKTTEKKTRSKIKENKIDENKSKFRELFGDSSLITPEDLGIPTKQTANTKKYEPIFEDAQDATDVNVTGKVGTQKQSCQSKETSSVIESLPDSGEKEKVHSLRISLPNILKPSVDVKKANKNPEGHLPIQQVMPHVDVVNKEVDTTEPDDGKTLMDSTGAQSRINEIESQIPINNKDETTHIKIVDKKQEVHLPIQQVTPNMNVGNLEVDTKESDVVKTVIISTGVQPQIEEIESQILNSDADKAVDTQPKVQEHKPITTTVATEIPILALATSTPHKNHLSIEASVESSGNSSDTGIDQSSKSAVVETQNAEEVPDVRIFVRRRRKLKK